MKTNEKNIIVKIDLNEESLNFMSVHQKEIFFEYVNDQLATMMQEINRKVSIRACQFRNLLTQVLITSDFKNAVDQIHKS